MTAAKKLLLTIEDFEFQYQDTRCQYHEGEIWEAQAASPDHSFTQGTIMEVLGSHFNRKGGPKNPGGWWIGTEVAVRYANSALYAHDLAGWKRSRVPTRPNRYPVTERPDWVCEILSSNASDDLVKKKKTLFENEVPFYWIVHPSDRVVSVFQWTEKGYLSILDFDEHFVGHIPPFDAVQIAAARFFGIETDEE